MKSQQVDKLNIPDSPGVYFFKSEGRILYIGKATTLKDRVKSYFGKDISFARSLLIKNMIEEAETVDWVETDSVLEALILEANLIKKHKPKYNTKEKDDKSFNYVVITKEDFPRVFTVRETELTTKYEAREDFKYIFGPYPSGSLLRDALKIIRKIFPYRGRKDPVERKRRRSALNEEIGITPKFQTGKVEKKEYQKTINNIRLFFQGKKSKVIKNLEREMKDLAEEEKFEEAAEVRRQINALKHINDIALMKSGFYGDDKREVFRIEAYDIAHTSEKNRVGVMVSFRGAEPDKKYYRKFKINTDKKGDIAALGEVLERRLGHPEWPFPKLIVLDGGKAQLNAGKRILKLYGYKIPVVSVVKDEYHKPREILGKKEFREKYEDEILKANAEAHRFVLKYHKNKRSF